MKPLVELVSTGNELLNGRTLNSHAQVLGEKLFPLGFQLVRDTTVGDDIAAIRDAVASALARVDIVVVTGGLGPTSDDVTREALAEVFGCGIRTDTTTLDVIAERMAKRNRKMNPSLKRHALVLDIADALPNSAGLAPGERIIRNGKVVFMLPGPPREFAAVLNEQVLPWLEKNVPERRPPQLRRFHVCGIGESDIVMRLEPRGFPLPGIDVAYSAKPAHVQIMLLRGASAGPGALENTAKILLEGIGEHVFSEGGEAMEEVVGRLLRARHETLATAESCTGGLIGHRITNISGSSDYFLGGIVAYANEIKVRELGVRTSTLVAHGAVSMETAQEMADCVRAKFGATWGIGVTGIAGPSGGSDEKPVGLVFIGIAGPDETTVSAHRFAGDRLSTKDWAAQFALDRLRRRLTGS